MFHMMFHMEISPFSNTPKDSESENPPENAEIFTASGSFASIQPQTSPAKSDLLKIPWDLGKIHGKILAEIFGIFGIENHQKIHFCWFLKQLVIFKIHFEIENQLINC